MESVFNLGLAMSALFYCNEFKLLEGRPHTYTMMDMGKK